MRPNNFCQKCTNGWASRGQHISRTCPKCKSTMLLEMSETKYTSYVLCLWGGALIATAFMSLVYLNNLWMSVVFFVASVFFVPAKERECREAFVKDLYIILSTRNPQFAKHCNLKWPINTPHFVQVGIAKWQHCTSSKNAQQPKHVRKSIPKPQKEAIWRRQYGTSIQGTCCICHFNRISAFRFHCGHIVSLKYGGTNHVDNFVPICDACNLSMGAEDMFEFQARLL